MNRYVLVAPDWPETVRTPDGHYYTRDAGGNVLAWEAHVAWLRAQGYKDHPSLTDPVAPPDHHAPGAFNTTVTFTPPQAVQYQSVPAPVPSSPIYVGPIQDTATVA